MKFPNHNKILVKITSGERDNLFNKKIEREDGILVELAISYEIEDDKLDASYAQNVSVGEVVGVGSRLKDKIQIGDIAIIDYLVDNDRLALVEETQEYKIVSVWANTTYHDKDAEKEITGRRQYYKGEYEKISQVFGVIRGNKLIALDPYIFLEHESNVINQCTVNNFGFEETVSILERKVLASFPGANAKEGEIIVIPDSDIFERVIDKKVLSTCFNIDVKCFVEGKVNSIWEVNKKLTLDQSIDIATMKKHTNN